MALKKQSFSRLHLLVFTLVFGLIGIIIWRSLAAPNPNLTGDLDGNNTVDVTDLSILLSHFGTNYPDADIDNSGLVDVTDLSKLLSHFGESYTPSANCSTSTNSWQNTSFANQTGTFTITYAATPSAQGIDGVIGFSDGAATDYDNLGVSLRFSTANTIEGLNGSNYTANTTVNYTAGKSYNFRLSVNISNHTYNAYVTPAGGSEVQIASNYVFRPTQASATQLNNAGYITAGNTMQICQISVNGTTAPPPSGTIRNASPGNLLSVIDQSAGGDTVLLASGNYSKLILDKSAPLARVTVKCSPGAVIAGVDTNGQSNYTFDSCQVSLPVETLDNTVRPVENRGPSQNITWQNCKITGGFTSWDVYGGPGSWAKNIVIVDSEISGGGGDLIHTNGVDGLKIEHNTIHDPYHDFSLGDKAEHHDGWQPQNTSNAQFLRNHVYWTSGPGAYTQMGPYTAVSQGIMISGDGGTNTNLTVANNLIEHYTGRPMNMNNTNGMKIVNNTFLDSGDGISITIGSNMSGLEIWNNIINSAWYEGTTTPTFFDNNWIVGGVNGGMGNITGTNYYTGNPGFSNLTTYALTVGGSAYTKGIVRTGTPVVDIDNVTRPNPPALGARL